MSSDRLPPLTALRAFEAAARHLSFARAADELNVTPAALSFQIKSLEEHLGTPLFHRMNRAVALTEPGRILAPGASDGFATLSAAWRAARRAVDETTLTVTAGPAVTAVWLAPRFYDFAQAHPEIELRFSAAVRMMDFDRDEIDVAIRFGTGPDTGLHADPLLPEYFTPMMTPDMAERFGTLEGLKTAPILHDDSVRFLEPPRDWAAWLTASGLTRGDMQGPRFSQADHALDAAIAGAGVVLGRTTLAAKALRDGRLVAPFEVALDTPASFRMLCQKGTEDRPRIKAFREWILAEIADAKYPIERHRIVSPGT